MIGPALATAPLRNIFLHVTRACNLRCSYCYLAAGQASRGELSAATLARLWPQVVAVRPQKVVFTGGEPLLRPDLCALLEGIKLADPEHLVLRCLNTNGLLMTHEWAQALVPLADEVRVSVDALRDRNDRLRDIGSFDAAVRALDTLYAAGFEPIAMVTVTRSGLADLEELLAFLLERRITRVHLNPFRAIGRGAACGDWAVAPQEVRAALDRIRERLFPGQPPAGAQQTECMNCAIGSFLNILPEGDVFPCHVLATPAFRLGNVSEHSLSEMCAAGGPLGQLQSLDFRQPLVKPGTCLGTLYRQARAPA